MTPTPKKKFTLVGHRNGILKAVSIETLKIEQIVQIPLYHSEEEVSCAVFNPNGINFAIGTSQGNVYLGSVREDNMSKPKISIGKLDNISKSTSSSITSLQFSIFDPIGSLLVAFDNGTIKTW